VYIEKSPVTNQFIELDGAAGSAEPPRASAANWLSVAE
jgi:hypothetical protein